MLRIIIIFSILLLAGSTHAQTTQNYILNNSFEARNSASPNYGDIAGGGVIDTNFVNSVLPCWTSPSTVSNAKEYAVVKVDTANRRPFSLNEIPPAQHGENVIWTQTFFDTYTKNSYFYNIGVQTKLNKPLIAGVQYQLSGYINTFGKIGINIDTNNLNSFWGEFKNIGFHISSQRIIDTLGFYNSAFFYIAPTLTYTVQHISVGLLNLTPWQRFELKFTATGGEQYLSIANFDSTRNNIFLYPKPDSLANTRAFPNFTINTYYDNLTLIPLSDTGLLVVNPHVADPDSMLLDRAMLICKDSNSITLSTATDFVSYVWSTGDTSRAITVSTPGSYTLTVYNGCATHTDTIQILADTTMRTGYTIADTTICSNQFLTYTLPDSFSANPILWSNGDTGLTASFRAGVHQLQLSNQCFQFKDTFTIRYTGADTLALFTDSVRQFCPNQTYLLNTAKLYPAYKWSNNEQSPTISLSQAGLYSLTVTDFDGCEIKDSVRFVQPWLPTRLLSQDSLLVCPMAFPISVSADTGFVQYKWNGILGTNNYSIASAFSPLIVAGTTLCGTVLDTLYIKTIEDLMGISFEVDSNCDENTVSVLARTLGSPTLVWSTGSTDSMVTLSPPQQLSIAAKYQCASISETITIPACFINAPLLYIPNAFSPNGDGNNDTYQLFAKNVDFQHLKIFNRWGEKVFETTDIKKAWDGIYKGEQAPTGIYTYTISYTPKDTNRPKQKSGSITLMR